jgi:hypothetical protein
MGSPKPQGFSLGVDRLPLAGREASSRSVPGRWQHSLRASQLSRYRAIRRVRASQLALSSDPCIPLPRGADGEMRAELCQDHTAPPSAAGDVRALVAPRAAGIPDSVWNMDARAGGAMRPRRTKPALPWRLSRARQGIRRNRLPCGTSDADGRAKSSRWPKPGRRSERAKAREMTRGTTSEPPVRITPESRTKRSKTKMLAGAVESRRIIFVF